MMSYGFLREDPKISFDPQEIHPRLNGGRRRYILLLAQQNKRDRQTTVAFTFHAIKNDTVNSPKTTRTLKLCDFI